MTTTKTTCTKCGLPIHQETVRPLHKKIHMEFMHDDLDTAWDRIDGYARNLHFAEPLLDKEENIRVEKVISN